MQKTCNTHMNVLQFYLQMLNQKRKLGSTFPSVTTGIQLTVLHPGHLWMWELWIYFSFLYFYLFSFCDASSNGFTSSDLSRNVSSSRYCYQVFKWLILQRTGWLSHKPSFVLVLFFSLSPCQFLFLQGLITAPHHLRCQRWGSAVLNKLMVRSLCCCSTGTVTCRRSFILMNIMTMETVCLDHQILTSSSSSWPCSFSSVFAAGNQKESIFSLRPACILCLDWPCA